MKYSPEQLVQLACVDLTRVACPGVLLSASQNGLYLGGARSVAAYVEKQPRLGLLPGEMDLMLTWAGKNILFCEVKSKEGTVSDNQKKVMEIRILQGFDFFVAWSIEDYFNGLRNFKVPMRRIFYPGVGWTS